MLSSTKYIQQTLLLIALQIFSSTFNVKENISFSVIASLLTWRLEVKVEHLHASRM